MTQEGLIDLAKDRATLSALYAPPAGDFCLVDVPKLPFAILDGEGPPDQATIGAAVKALYTAIYAIRRKARERAGKAFVEAPVEILYWADDLRELASGRRDKWRWRAQITLPVWADAGHLEDSVAEMRHQLGDAPNPRWEVVSEGRCAQYLHTGQTGDLPTILQALYNDYLPAKGLEPAGPYHEIYLDDWSRVAPMQRKTILRQPVRAV